MSDGLREAIRMVRDWAEAIDEEGMDARGLHSALQTVCDAAAQVETLKAQLRCARKGQAQAARMLAEAHTELDRLRCELARLGGQAEGRP